MRPWRARRWVFEGERRDLAAISRLDDGAEMSVRFLSPTMARVTLRPQGGWREPRTWAIAPLAGSGGRDNSFSRDVPWDGRAREDLTGFERPAVTRGQSDGIDTLATGSLEVRLHGAPLRLEWRAIGVAHPVAQDRPTSAYLSDARTGAVRHYLARDPREHFYGLGDKTGPLNLHGRRLRTAAMDSLGYDPEHGDPLYKHWPFVLSRSPEGRWVGIYYDTMAVCIFDLGCEHDNYHGLYRYIEIDDGDLDYYLMAGRTPAEVIAQFVALIGGTHLPPRWSLGFGQTAMGLTDAPDAQQQLEAFINRTVSERVPVSTFHYGSGYSTRGTRRYVFTWNRDKFPDPTRVNARFHGTGMHVVANIKPCLLNDHPAYREARDRGVFVSRRLDRTPVVEPFWDGQGSYVDFTRPEGVRWWQDGLKAQVLAYGIDAGWNDNNEYAIQDEDAVAGGFGQPMPLHRSRPLQGLLMTRATFEAQQEHRPDEPVFTVTRAGMPGIQRYAQTWSGDNTTSWRTLKWNIRTGLQMSLSGMFNVGHDVGGFSGPVPDPELFLRWVQACSLNPRMVMNSWKAGGSINLPWMHPSVTAAVKRAIELRYRLLPYLWSLFERANQHQEPIIRPTFYDFPDDAQCLQDCDEFMLGRELLVAPVVEPGATTRRLYLPALPGGARWFDFETGHTFASGQWHEVAAPLDRLPLFAREGAAIPCAQPAPGQVARHDDPVTEIRRF
jgi:alpha-glucosidase